ncbi:hypothetical protein GX50_03355 [[Emmonsia] crescens]|uniref:Uncharacterized protein n=1 Tax=[Emmonsia] crescens TaxID=73230 RepID=A0A2B7ZII7_9EURO|nr:hypothetical protein GX50_03355 [Emmonsia crescens]
MYVDPDGFLHVGDDGVMRSLSAAGAVLDYALLTRDQLQGIISIPSYTSEEKKHLSQLWSAVNTSQVSVEQLRSPPKELLPTLLMLAENQPLEPPPSSSPISVRAPKGLSAAGCAIRLCSRSTQCMKHRNCYVCVLADRLSIGKCV